MIFGPWQNAGKTQTCCCVHGSVWAEWEGVWNWKLPWAFCPRHGLCAGVSFTKWCFYGQGLLQMLPGSLKKNETVSAASLTLKYCSVCVNYFLHKRCFKLQSYACSLKKCLCIWGWLHVVHKKFFQICIETYWAIFCFPAKAGRSHCLGCYPWTHRSKSRTLCLQISNRCLILEWSLRGLNWTWVPYHCAQRSHWVTLKNFGWNCREIYSIESLVWFIHCSSSW